MQSGILTDGPQSFQSRVVVLVLYLIWILPSTTHDGRTTQTRGWRWEHLHPPSYRMRSSCEAFSVQMKATLTSSLAKASSSEIWLRPCSVTRLLLVVSRCHVTTCHNRAQYREELPGVDYLCYLDTNPLRVIFSAGLPGRGANRSLILTLPAVPIPTTTAPSILQVQNRGWGIELQTPGSFIWDQLLSDWLSLVVREEP